MKKILAVILAVILALSLSVAAVTAAPALPSASKVEKDLYWVGFMADGGFSGQAPDDVVHYTTYINGYLDKWEYYNEDIGLYGYKLTYDEYIGVVDSLFANHSDMKTYLENHGYYDAATGMVDFLSISHPYSKFLVSLSAALAIRLILFLSIIIRLEIPIPFTA